MISNPAGARFSPFAATGSLVRTTCKFGQAVRPDNAAVILAFRSASPMPNCTKTAGRSLSKPSNSRADDLSRVVFF
ncbi:unannotated protein [freshwater metagenome]|uniref:Unannotated protein n=1 Tax=freshwater metagenome TaxID=449393 RepID=A0A6J6KSJ6_9ZZZZ